MYLNTFPFFVFFLIVFFIYWKIPKRYRWILLLLASIYFYGSWKPVYLLLLFVTTAVNYYAAILIGKRGDGRKAVLTSAIAIDLGILFVFKYLLFFDTTVSQLFSFVHRQINFPQFTMLLPLGISFYTFQALGYLIDVYRRSVKPERNFGMFTLFLTFFPQISSGPIERAGELLPQLRNLHEFRYENAASGLKLFTFGLFKKMVIADNLAIIVDRVFNSLPEYKGFSLVTAVILFSWQLYMDFAGYTDMARGVARMLGIELVPNFNTPYLATSVRDFWRRWHMSLSRWFRDYVYIPLGGNRGGILRTCINGLVVFTLVGVWHGASWKFVIWGAIHGTVIAMERLLSQILGRIRVPVLIKIIYTYSVVCISLVFFRANTLADALYVFRYAAVGIGNFIKPGYIMASLNQIFHTNMPEMLIAGSLMLTAVLIETLSRNHVLKRVLNRQSAALRFTVYVLTVFAIIQLRVADIQKFIYVRF